MLRISPRRTSSFVHFQILNWQGKITKSIVCWPRVFRNRISYMLISSTTGLRNCSHFPFVSTRAIIDLARRLLENAASLYTLNGLTNFLQSQGHKVPKNSVADYLNWFEDAFFLFTVRIFNASVSKSNANSGMRNAGQSSHTATWDPCITKRHTWNWDFWSHYCDKRGNWADTS